MQATSILLGIVIAVTAALVSGWLFRALLVAVTSGELRRSFRGAPVTASFGMLVILLYFVVAVLAPILAPFPERQVVGAQYLPWEAPYYLGTDNLGRDMLTRLIYGARNTVGIAFATTGLALGLV